MALESSWAFLGFAKGEDEFGFGGMYLRLTVTSVYISFIASYPVIGMALQEYFYLRLTDVMA